MYTAREIDRLIANIFTYGTVTEITGDRARVEFGGNQSAALRWLTSRAGKDRTWHAPSVGEQVLVACPIGDTAQGVIIGSLYKKDMPAPTLDSNIYCQHFTDGCVISYDSKNHALSATLPDGGTAALTATGGITITGDTKIIGNTRIEGETTITKDLSVKQSISADDHVSDGTSSMQSMRSTYNSHKHLPYATTPAIPSM